MFEHHIFILYEMADEIWQIIFNWTNPFSGYATYQNETYYSIRGNFNYNSTDLRSIT